MALRHLAIFKDDLLRSRLVHGSDWPILPVPPMKVGLGSAMKLWTEPNWLKRDVLIKRKLNFDDAYFHRAAKVLRLA